MSDPSAELMRLRKALRLIRGEACERSTAGLGSCFGNGYTPNAEYGADRCCHACIADAALRQPERAA